jgi:hypothetical protein
MAGMEEDAVFSNPPRQAVHGGRGRCARHPGMAAPIPAPGHRAAQAGHEVCRPGHAGPRGRHLRRQRPLARRRVRIAPGDLIFGDREGVLAIPSEVAAEAIEKASTENRVATAIRHGMGAREAFETFGVL